MSSESTILQDCINLQPCRWKIVAEWTGLRRVPWGGEHPCLSAQNCWPTHLAAGQAGKNDYFCQSCSQTAVQLQGCKKPFPNSTWPSPTSHLHCQPWSLPDLTLLPPSGQLMQNLSTELDCLHRVLKGNFSFLVSSCHGSWCCLDWYFFFDFIVKPSSSLPETCTIVSSYSVWDTEGAMQDTVIFFQLYS